jgi:hypothetical protein
LSVGGQTNLSRCKGTNKFFNKQSKLVTIMDFSSLGQGSPLYILRQGEKPTLEVGTVKAKTQPHVKFPTSTPSIMTGLQPQQIIDITVTLNGKDETYNDIPVGVEIAAKGNVTFSGSREAMLQAVDNMLQTSKKALEQIPLHKNVIAESEKMLEVLNPRYAEEKKQARTITDLERRQSETDKKLDAILGILQKLDSPSPSKV